MTIIGPNYVQEQAELAAFRIALERDGVVKALCDAPFSYTSRLIQQDGRDVYEFTIDSGPLRGRRVVRDTLDAAVEDATQP